MAQLPIVLIAGAAGVWLFYVQHHFEGVYWARHDEWDPWRAALVRAVKPLTIRGSLKALWFSLYDEQQGKLISFRELRALPQRA